MPRIVILLLSATLFFAGDACGDEASDNANDEAGVRAAGNHYVEAFNSGDADAVAALWSPDAVYTNRTSGEKSVGREAIQKEFASLFEEVKDGKLDVSVESIQFVSPNVAVEHGTARFLHPDQSPTEAEYTAVYVRRDGKWLLDRVADKDIATISSHYEQLKELEWMIGRWVDEDEDASVVTECSWTRNNNFITRAFTVQIGEQIDLAGMQIIGWDPATQKIRSWVFDSDGGFGQATWSCKGDRWFAQRSGVLPDGRKSSSVNILTYLDDNACTIQSISRMLDGELLPNIEEVRVVKQ